MSSVPTTSPARTSTAAPAAIRRVRRARIGWIIQSSRDSRLDAGRREAEGGGDLVQSQVEVEVHQKRLPLTRPKLQEGTAEVGTGQEVGAGPHSFGLGQPYHVPPPPTSHGPALVGDDPEKPRSKWPSSKGLETPPGLQGGLLDRILRLLSVLQQPERKACGDTQVRSQQLLELTLAGAAH